MERLVESNALLLLGDTFVLLVSGLALTFRMFGNGSACPSSPVSHEPCGCAWDAFSYAWPCGSYVVLVVLD